MSISVSTNGSAVSSKNAPARLQIPVQETDYTQIRVEMTQALQVTLDLNILLELYFEQLQKIMSFQGLMYTNKAQDYQTLVGHEQIHRVNYSLKTQQHEDLGEIVFSRHKRFSEADMGAIECTLTSLICPLRNALQYRDALRQAMKDPLTGVGNRAALDSSLNREIQLARRYEQPLSLLVIDIDHFKSVNDKYGHICGDEVLKDVAQSIQAVSRLTDLTFRYGGEEFVLVLNKTPAAGAEVIAERLRKFIGKMRTEAEGHLIRSSISVGFATLKDTDNAHALFDRADKALYKAKTQGRNQCVYGG